MSMQKFSSENLATYDDFDKDLQNLCKSRIHVRNVLTLDV